MRTKMQFLIITITLVFSACTAQNQTSTQQRDVSYEVFYDELSPYGQWLDYPNYGYVWLPDAGPNFSPYSSNGHWVHTRYGWTWMSDYNWGWAPFHYGRWDYDSFYGWLWVPGYEWGPSWVNWRSGSGYYGWQPMRPGYGIYSGFYGDRYTNYDHWTFVGNNHFGRPDVYNYYVNRSDYMRIIENSSLIDNNRYDHRRQVSYSSGPERREVERSTGSRVRSVTISDNDNPVQQLSNNRLELYRPQFNERSESDLLRRIETQEGRQLPVDNRRSIEQQQRTTPQNTRPVQNPQINRGERERVQPATPARVPAETPRRGERRSERK